MSQKGKVLCGGISRIDLSLSNKWKTCHGAINSRSRNLRAALVKYFRFHLNFKQLRVETRDNMSDWNLFSSFI